MSVRSTQPSARVAGTTTSGHVATFTSVPGVLADGGVVPGTGTVTHTGSLTAGRVVEGNGVADVTISSLTATVVKAAAGALSAASAGTDYVAPGGALGTPSSGTLTSCTGLPLTTGVTGDLPFANLTQASAASKLLGRGSAGGAGDYEEITISTGLTMTGTTLTATGGGTGTVTNTGTLTSGKLIEGNGGVDVTVSSLTATVVKSSSGTLSAATAGTDYVAPGGALGTPSSGTLTSCTGLPLTTGVTGDLALSNLAQASAASVLLGRGSASGAGDFQEITLGTGLVMASQALNAGLTQAAGGADAAQTMAVNALYVVDISGYTADRTYTLPAVAAVGDRVGILLTVGDTAFELLITAASGDTLNGVAGGTEWSRIFIANEYVEMICVAASATWIVSVDGRIPQKGLITLTTQATGESANTTTQPTAKGGVWTATQDNASITTIASDQIKTRRAGTFLITVYQQTVSNATSGNYYNGWGYLTGTSGTLTVATQQIPGATANAARNNGSKVAPLVVDDYITFAFRSQDGSKGCAVGSYLSLTEVLP